MVAPQDFSKVSIKPKRHHGFNVLLFILGTLFPPLAVAARFGIGTDFFLNLILTICGYIPGHVHNFYIQNIRNNKNHRRTPKWAQQYGLVDTSTIKRHEKRSQWAARYNERNPHSTLEDQAYEAGQIAGSTSSLPTGSAPVRSQRTGELWNQDDEHYYNANNDSGSVQSSSRWRYPANFEDTMPPEPPKKKKVKKDRHARTEDAYTMPDDSGNRRRKKKKRSNRAPVDDYAANYSRSSLGDGPENPEGGVYGRSEPQRANGAVNEEDMFRHEF
ncbi:hypothetical protein K488DRAFT_50235 [Vararia minispora EC-137]|uniref:Uncharacterized protein n=1 Tax=Vararia minispora EC-137 TaxID=1314806 RepID=A0ACB8QKC3_9AGAM|nr:hypothetical protein K488DRAFT_50235 [Vararia minispora EC-137]